jgi:outer membrane immunogenic protein
MTKWTGAGTALYVLALAGSAHAADLAPVSTWTKAPVAPSVSVPSWTGFYAGLGIGFRSTRNDLTSTSLLFDGVPQDLSGAILSQPFNDAGFRVAPYVGYNWQVARQWVVGIEGDLGFGNHTSALSGFEFSPVLGSNTGAGDSLAVKTTWDGSLRGSLGYLLTPSTLIYTTGGVAWQHDDVISTCGNANSCAGNGITPAVVTNSVTRTGWTVGGGIETALGGNWLARAEYRYADFGTAAMNVTRNENPPLLTVDNFEARLRTHLASFGVAYKFGDQLSAASEPVYPVKAQAGARSWGGLYIGLGAGARATRADAFDAFESQDGFTFNNLLDRSRTQSFDGTSAVVNPYIGYNFQFAPRWIAGIEGDFGFGDQATTRDGFTLAELHDYQPGESTTLKATWDVSLRGRVGYLVTPATLLYATGGVAWQHFEFGSACLSQVCAAFAFTPAVVNQAVTRAGGTVGGGIETALGGNWLLRGEYRYADYGHASFTVARSSTNIFENPTINTTDITLRTHTATFGLAYKFD